MTIYKITFLSDSVSISGSHSEHSEITVFEICSTLLPECKVAMAVKAMYKQAYCGRFSELDAIAISNILGPSQTLTSRFATNNNKSSVEPRTCDMGTTLAALNLAS
jgi:hypothetical protein